MNKKLISALAAAGIIALTGCGSDSSSTAAAPTYTRVAPLAAQTATISIADPAGTPVVTITSQPADIELSGTAVAVSGTNTTLSLTATNNSERILFGGKVVVNTVIDSTVTNAVSWNATGITGDTGEAFATLGFNAIDMGGSADTVDAISFTDLDGLDNPLVITVTLPTNEHMAYGEDSSSSNNYIEYLDMNGNLANDSTTLITPFTAGSSAFLEPAISDDGRYVYSGNRNKPLVMVLDTVTLAVAGINLAPEAGTVGSVAGVELSSDGQFLYAAYVTNAHFNGAKSPIGNNLPIEAFAVKINQADHTIVSQVALPTAASSEITARSIDLSGDDSTLVIGFKDDSFGGGGSPVFTVNTADMTVAKIFDAPHPRQIAINNDASKIYYAQGNSTNTGTLFEIDTATGAHTEIALTNTVGSTPVALEFGPDGRLYYVRNTSIDGIAIFDFSVDNTDVVVDTVGTPCGIDFYRGGGKYFLCENGDFSTWDITDDTMIQGPSTSGTFGKHGFVVSTY